MKKQFIVEMDTDIGCDLSHHCVAVCQHRAHLDMACKADIDNRPTWCPLQEHSIGECHIKYKEQQPYWEHKF